MKLLWMKSDFVLPPDTGGKIRTYNLLRELRRLCDVTYACFTAPGSAPLDAAEVASSLVTIERREESKSGLELYTSVLRRIPSPVPFTAQKYRDERFSRAQREFLGSAGAEPAVVLCDFLEMAENVDWSLTCPKVLFQHNVETDLWDGYHQREANPLRRLYLDFERRRMARYEASRCARFDQVFVVTDEDRKTLRDRMGVRRPIELLEAGVDTQFFHLAPHERSAPERILFLGSLDWRPNLDGMDWFLTEIYPEIRRSRPKATLDIVGRRPSPEFLARVENEPSVRLHADVPDVRPFVAACELFVVPLRIGGGSRIKIYEAMAMQRPVLSTTLGAQGLGLQDGRQVALADSARDFALASIELLADESRRRTMANHGAEWVRRECSWADVAARLHRRCLELVEER